MNDIGRKFLYYYAIWKVKSGCVTISIYLLLRQGNTNYLGV
mgnify:CR=1 FL=1